MIYRSWNSHLAFTQSDTSLGYTSFKKICFVLSFLLILFLKPQCGPFLFTGVLIWEVTKAFQKYFEYPVTTTDTIGIYIVLCCFEAVSYYLWGSPFLLQTRLFLSTFLQSKSFHLCCKCVIFSHCARTGISCRHNLQRSQAEAVSRAPPHRPGSWRTVTNFKRRCTRRETKFLSCYSLAIISCICVTTFFLWANFPSWHADKKLLRRPRKWNSWEEPEHDNERNAEHDAHHWVPETGVHSGRYNAALQLQQYAVLQQVALSNVSSGCCFWQKKFHWIILCHGKQQDVFFCVCVDEAQRLLLFCSDFVAFTNYQYGNCYTFNTQQDPDKKRMVNKAGKDQGEKTPQSCICQSAW